MKRASRQARDPRCLIGQRDDPRGGGRKGRGGSDKTFDHDNADALAAVRPFPATAAEGPLVWLAEVTEASTYPFGSRKKK